MPDETLQDTLNETASEADGSGAEQKAGEKAVGSTRVAPPSVLQRDSDRVARPGFRNPPNSKSKAQKSGRKK